MEYQNTGPMAARSLKKHPIDISAPYRCWFTPPSKISKARKSLQRDGWAHAEMEDHGSQAPNEENEKAQSESNENQGVEGGILGLSNRLGGATLFGALST